MGVSHSDKTDHSYYYEEAMALKNQGTITIRAIKDYSAVVTKPDLEKYLYQNHTNERVGATIQCQYCGKDILDSDVVCPHCKSRIIK